jgi:hypothetical protein
MCVVLDRDVFFECDILESRYPLFYVTHMMMHCCVLSDARLLAHQKKWESWEPHTRWGKLGCSEHQYMVAGGCSCGGGALYTSVPDENVWSCNCGEWISTISVLCSTPSFFQSTAWTFWIYFACFVAVICFFSFLTYLLVHACQIMKCCPSHSLTPISR